MFREFLKSLKRADNKSILEAILKGYDVFESIESPDINSVIEQYKNDSSKMIFWHGGDLNRDPKFRKGKFEFGPGLYATTHYDTALKYSKGSRKFYLLVIEKGNVLSEAILDFESVIDFVKHNVIRKLQPDVISRLGKYNDNGKIKADILNNIIINEEAIKASNIDNLRKFFVDNGIDYDIVNRAFGYDDSMIVLFNMDKLETSIRVPAGYKLNTFDLFESEYVDSLPGGLADKKQPEDFNQTELAKGIKVELEHTKDEKLATEIAMDHLMEDPHYYTHLIKMEKGLHESVEYFGVDDGDIWQDGEALDDSEEILNQAYSVVSKSGINMLRNDEINEIAIQDNQVVGVLYTSLDDNKITFSIAVDENYRSQGIAKKLFNSVYAIADEYDHVDTIIGELVPPYTLESYVKNQGFKLINESGNFRIYAKKV